MKTNVLSDLIKKMDNVQITINDTNYKISTKIKFLMRLEDNYKKYLSNGERVTFLKIIKDNFEFILTFNELKKKDEYDKETIAMAVLSDAMENVDLYALSIMLYSLIDDENLTFEEFLEFDVLDFVQTNFSKIIDDVYNDVVNIDDSVGEDEKKLTVAKV